MSTLDPCPPYAYIPGGRWPRPDRSELASTDARVAEALQEESSGWTRCPAYLRGVGLFNEGYYWEAHEAWESLWQALGRVGPTADLLKALIKLAAAGVKVRQGQPHGVLIHARRAVNLIGRVRQELDTGLWLGLDLDVLHTDAEAIAASPPAALGPCDAPVVRVFAFQLDPRLRV